MGKTSVKHKIVEAQFIKNTCEKNSEGNKIDLWERHDIWTVARYFLLMWGMGKLPLKYKCLTTARNKH